MGLAAATKVVWRRPGSILPGCCRSLKTRGRQGCRGRTLQIDHIGVAGGRVALNKFQVNRGDPVLPMPAFNLELPVLPCKLIRDHKDFAVVPFIDINQDTDNQCPSLTENSSFNFLSYLVTLISPRYSLTNGYPFSAQAAMPPSTI